MLIHNEKQNKTWGTNKTKILFIHRWLGLISGCIVLIVALTGCVYVFEEEIRNSFQYKFYHIPLQGNTSTIALDQLQIMVNKKFPKEQVTSIRLKQESNAAYIFITKKDKAISINPYTGSVIGVKNTKKDFLNTVLRLHRTLLLGEVGKQIIKWNALIFFIMCVSGLILWWPKQKSFLKQAITIKFKTQNWKQFNWKLHSVLGFYALGVLLLISVTGMFFAFDAVKNTIKVATHQPIIKKEENIKSRYLAGVRVSLNEVYQQVKNTYTDNAKETIIILPADSLAPIKITITYNYAVVKKINVLFFDQYNGQVLKKNLFNNYTAYDKISRSNYQLHTGNIPPLGIVLKLIYFFASLFAASLPITGFLIWRGRKKTV